MSTPQIPILFNGAKSQHENLNLANSSKVAKKSEIIKAELQKYRILKSKRISADEETENKQNKLFDPNFSLNSNILSPQMNPFRNENIASSELLSPRTFH